MSKYRNYGLWFSTITNVGTIISLLGYAQDKVNIYVKIAIFILGLLTQFGIISNPEKGKWYSDSQPESLDETLNLDNKL